jgi:hypothetical protein
VPPEVESADEQQELDPTTIDAQIDAFMAGAAAQREASG